MAQICSSDRKTTDTFKALQNESWKKNERNDCVVKALAIVCDLPYDVVHSALAKHGRKNCQVTRRWVTTAALKELGFSARAWTYQERRAMIASYPGAHSNLQNITVHHPVRFAAAWSGQPPTLLFMNGHVAALRDDLVHDWTKGTSRRVCEIWTITKE